MDIASPQLMLSLVGLICIGAWLSGGLSLIYDIQFTEDGFAIVVLRSIPIYKIPYSNIVRVRRVFGGYFDLAALNLKNRPMRPTFRIELKKSILAHKVLVTPHDPMAFQKLAETAGVYESNAIPEGGNG